MPAMELRDPQLLRELAYVDGGWIRADGGATLRVDNPATGAQIGVIPNMGATETRFAIRAAAAALPGWSAVSYTHLTLPTILRV